MLGRAVQHPDLIPMPELVAMIRDTAACTVLVGLLQSVARDGPLPAGLDRVECPIRIAWAENDRTIPFERFGRPLLDLVPAAEHVTLPGVGHVPMYDDPELVVQTILDVTLRVDGASADGRQERSA
jgi:pimeloyl-ACP methyl ester carboxylesterase